MATLYMHIGSSKTGTSAIQIFLGENMKALEEQGIAFPIFDIQYPTIRKQRNAHFMVDKTEEQDANYEHILEQIKELAAKNERIILTDESIWNNPKNVKRFSKDMKEAGIELKLVVYLRRQDLYLQSQWAQNVKENMTIDFYNYTKQFRIKMNYYEQLCKLRDIVGAENLLVRPYEKQQFAEGNLLIDFMKTVGIEKTDAFVFQEKADNLSLSGIYLETKRMLNRNEAFATRANFIVPYLYQVMEMNDDVQFYSANKFFTYDQQMEFLSQYLEGNEMVAREFLGREDGVMFYDEIAKIEGASETFTTEEYMDVMAQIVLLQQAKIEALNRKRLEAIAKKQRKEALTFGQKVKRKIKKIVNRK